MSEPVSLWCNLFRSVSILVAVAMLAQANTHASGSWPASMLAERGSTSLDNMLLAKCQRLNPPCIRSNRDCECGSCSPDAPGAMVRKAGILRRLSKLKKLRAKSLANGGQKGKTLRLKSQEESPRPVKRRKVKDLSSNLWKQEGCDMETYLPNLVSAADVDGLEHKLMFDGGSRGNPGPAGCGFAIYQHNEVIAQGAVYLGENTNNYAEYMGLILGLEKASLLKIKELCVKGDSQLVLSQMTGGNRVLADHLKLVHERACGVTRLFDKIAFVHVLRKFNKLADGLANTAMDDGRVGSGSPTASMLPKSLRCYTDGQPRFRHTLMFQGISRQNRSGYGFAILEHEEIIFQKGQYLGQYIQPYVAYTGLIHGLLKASTLGITDLCVKGESELIIKQMTGAFKVQSDEMKSLHARACEAMKSFDKVEFLQVDRDSTKGVNALAIAAMDRIAKVGGH